VATPWPTAPAVRQVSLGVTPCQLVPTRANSCQLVPTRAKPYRRVHHSQPDLAAAHAVNLGRASRRAHGRAAWHTFDMTNALLERIVVDPAICFGRSTIRGHRLWVSLILGYLAEGWTVEAVVEEFTDLEVDDVLACIAYGAQLADVRFADLDAAG
jgi:uncharacterized protein (DUF433 family)